MKSEVSQACIFHNLVWGWDAIIFVVFVLGRSRRVFRLTPPLIQGKFGHGRSNVWLHLLVGGKTKIQRERVNRFLGERKRVVVGWQHTHLEPLKIGNDQLDNFGTVHEEFAFRRVMSFQTKSFPFVVSLFRPFFALLDVNGACFVMLFDMSTFSLLSYERLKG